MALTATSVLEVNQSALAADINGGAFDSTQAGSTGVDMTYGPNAAVINCSVTSTGNGTLTLTSGTVTDTVLGNGINVGPYTNPPYTVSVATATTGGTLPASTAYEYVITCVTASGLETNTSSSVSVTTGSGTATNENTITWNAVPNAASYNVYGRTSSSLLKIANTTSTSYTDTGSITPSGSPPSANQTFIGIINSFTNSTTVGVNTSNGSVPVFTAVAAGIGGPLKTCDYASIVTFGAAQSNVSPTVYLRGGVTYTPAIPLVWSNTNASPAVVGYYQTRGDITPFANQAYRPIIQNSAAIGNNCMFTVGNGNSFGTAYYIIFDGANLSNTLFTGSNGPTGCQFRNSSAIQQISACFSEFINISNYVVGQCTDCFFDNVDYFNINNGFAIRCILRACTSAAIQSGGNSGYVESCSVYGGKAGSISSSAWGGIISNNIFFGNGTPANVGDGFTGNAYTIKQYTNASDVPISGGTQVVANITLTANPFVNPTAAITNWQEAVAAFALNTVAGGGALCRGAGTPQYLDIGAVPSAPSGGGGFFIPGRGFSRGL